MDPPNGGCSPLSVNFKNTTAGASAAATYEWDFGNGNNKGYDKDAGSVYITEKSYTVTLTVRDGGKTASVNKTVTVYKRPSVKFSFSPQKGCAPFPVTFKSTSTAGDGSIAKYVWDFGDGTIMNDANLQQTTHTYKAPGSQTAILTVVNSYGCIATGEESGITILEPIKADFSVAKTALCAANESLQFTNKSTGPGTLSYKWDFENGPSSTEKNPIHTFTQKGIYTVKLTASNDIGCTNTVEKPDLINVANFSTDFSVPALICTSSEASFTNTSTPAPDRTTWQIEGGGTFYNSSLKYTFSTPGKYKIKMTSTYGSCSEVKEKEITVKAGPKLNEFSDDLNGVCGAPVTVKFSDNTPGVVKWQWQVDWTTTSNSKTFTHTFNNDGSYYVALQVTDAGGCSSTRGKYISLNKPNVNINTTGQTGGCPGLTTKFFVDDPSLIKEYQWNFGDGGTSTEAEPSYTFNKVGNYTVTLNYTTVTNCKGVEKYNTIMVYKKPKADFSVPSTLVCGNSLVNFINQTTGDASYWQWDFGDGNPNGQSTSSQSPVYYYGQEGEYTVTLIAGVGSCKDTMTKENFIKVLPPFPRIVTTTKSCVSGEVGFYQNTSNQAQKMWWDFGDGTVQQIDPTQYYTTHTYAKTGKYTVYLIAEAGQCTVRQAVTVDVLLAQKPVLSANLTEVCGSGDLRITISGLEADPYYSSNAVDHYQIVRWEYGDGTPVYPTYTQRDLYVKNNFSATITGLDNGQQNIRVIIASTSYPWCTYTSNFIPLKIKGPTADFGFAQNDVCFKLPIIFKDESKGNDGIPLKKWEWSFGDGGTTSFTDANYPDGGLLEHMYQQPGYYYPTLKVTDADGCTATTRPYTKYATLRGPKADFSYSPQNVFPYTQVYFSNNSNTTNSNPQFNWYFSNGPDYTNTYNPPSKSYTTLGTDTVTMITWDPQGCRDTIVKVIQIKDVIASFTFKDTYVNNTSCPPVIVNFTNTSQNAQRIEWDLGDGVISAVHNNTPTRTYYKSGVYKVTLYAYSNNNTVDSFTQFIAVKGPYATLKADTLSGCLQQQVTLSADVKNASSFTWDFGDGSLKQTTDTFATHSYARAGIYTPALILKDGSGCSGTSEMAEKIVIDSLAILAVKKEPLYVCDSGWVQFSPTIKSIAADNLQKKLSYSWNFGTGNAAAVSSENPASFRYNQTGNFPVTLKVLSPYGCEKERTDILQVIPTPQGRITGPAAICQDGAALFSATADISSNLQWRWSFGNGATANGQTPQEQLYMQSGIAAVQLLVENNGCIDTVVHMLTINRRPNVNLTPKDPAVCLGNNIQLSAEDGTQYKWSPSLYLNRNDIAQPVATPADDIRYTVEVTNTFGCKRSDSTAIKVAKPFTVQLTPEAYVCEGKSVQLPVTGADSYQWINVTTALSSTTSNNPTAAPKDSITYTVVGYDSYNCFTDTASVNVAVVPLPWVTAPPDMELPTGSEILLPTTASSDAIRWKWSPIDYLNCPTCPAPVSTPRSHIQYTVTVFNKFGCESSDTVAIKLVCAKGLVYIPNAFTPNGDYRNDVFYVKGKGIRAIKSMRVFNRWGQVVYEVANVNIEDPQKGWDGNYRGLPVESAAYIYYIELICDSGEIFSRKGTVTLIR